MIISLPVILLSALVPMVLGFLWYGPMLFGKVWQAETGITDEQIKGDNMPLMMGLGYVFAAMLAFALNGVVIHQNALGSLLMDEAISLDMKTALEAVQVGVADSFRSFKHGLIHGSFAGLFIALPLFASNALFERKSAKYVAVNAGYWIVTLALMGGIICQFT
ncbi:MAG: hypothetical protein ACI8ZN_002530 [Bacteroidia bacterium]|jgi:hypothetical protein